MDGLFGTPLESKITVFNQLRSGPDYIKNTGLTKYTVYPGECINLLQAITVYDVWGHDITNQTNLQADVLFGATEIFIVSSSSGDKCQCYSPLPTCLSYGYPYRYQFSYYYNLLDHVSFMMYYCLQTVTKILLTLHKY